jgi:hypothetical protein
MTITSELPINSLDYPDIRENLISFLQSQTDGQGFPIYQDYNFQASGVSTLINLLSYNTHYIGYYVKMLLNESFIDSSVKRESLLSKAKLTGYVPKGKTSSRIDISLTINIDTNDPEQYEPSSKSILIPRGTSFSGINTNLDQRIFYTVDDIFVKNIDYSSPTVIVYSSDIFTIYEGKFQEWKFKVDTTLLNQRYVIQDKNVDIDTIRIVVFPNGNLTGEEYFLATNVNNVDSNSKVYYLTTQEEGYFEVIFGNNVFGKMPGNNSIVYVYYISSNGESGNGCKRFRFNAPSQDIPTESNIGNWEDFEVVIPAGSVSSGGCEPETVESLRFTIPHHYRRQNRIVTADDFKSIIISDFRNIDSINVWGGEDNIYKDYGKIYLSIKPKFADKLTLTAKADIQNKLISKYCVVGMQPVFVDPEFVNVELTIYAKVDNKKTNLSFGQIEKLIVDVVTNYNTETLNVFDNFLSDVDLMTQIKNAIPAIKSCYSKKTLNKDQGIIYQAEIETALIIGNSIQTGVRSSLFTYGADTCYFADDTDGVIYIYKSSDNTKLLLNSFGRVDYTKGVIYYQFPKYGTLVNNNFVTYGVINFTAIPINPDIETYLQNIVRITKIRVVLTNA